MDGRGRLATLLLFVLLACVIILQVFSMVQSDHFYEALNRIEDAFESRPGLVELPAAQGDYPGDEGDWLIWAMHAEPKTMSQVSPDADIYSRWIVFRNILEPLMEYDWDDVTLRPLLAERYEMSGDGIEVTFHLRADVTFSDGEPVTADDVVFTYEMIRNPQVDAGQVAYLYTDVERCAKIDERTVKFTMKRPYFKALEALSFWDIGILPKHIYKFENPQEFNGRVSDPVGSGPYVFERWTKGREIVLRRNDNYWGPKPKLRKVVYRFITNAVAALQACRSHEVDMTIPEQDQFADLLGDTEFNKEFKCVSYYGPGTPFFYIGWNEGTLFFADRRVRLAMTHIVDRDKVVSELAKGIGRVITGPYYIDGPQNDPNISPWPHDLARANELLDEAGWRDSDGDGIRDKDGVPFRFKFLYAVDAIIYERLARLLKDECAKAGIDVIADPTEWSVLLPRLSDRKFEAMVMGWGGDIVEDNYQLFHSSQIGNRGSNYVGFRNTDADALLEEIRRTINDDRRNELCHRLHRIIHDEQPYTFLYVRPELRLVDRRFENVRVHKLGLNYREWHVPKQKQRYK